jgi:hypothetical protein
MDKQKIEKYLADKDGSLRDINIGHLNKNNVVNFLKWYAQNYNVCHVIDKDGKEVESILQDNVFENEDDFYLLLNGRGKENVLIKDLNAFITLESKGVYEIELDFSPDAYSYDAFVTFLKSILKHVKTKEFYVKYENVSWQYGDTSSDSGVIFCHRDIYDDK